jgi:hypothetical protein
MALTKVDLANVVTGVLPAANGGTGASSFPSPGTAGNVLTSNGTSWTSATAAAFSSGTLMLFQQTSAPTGWTKQTTHNDKALRVVSGSVSSGGSVGFTTAFASQAVSGSIANTTAGGSISVDTSGLSAGATTLTTSQIPNHFHRQYYNGSAGGTQGGQDTYFGYAYNDYVQGTEANWAKTGNTGGGGSHTHSVSGSATSTFTGSAHNHSFTGTAINLAVSYVDLIIASKD